MTATSKAFSRALGWVENRQDQFSIQGVDLKYSKSMDRFKPYGELIYTLMFLNSKIVLPNWATTKIDEMWRELDQGRVLIEILLSRPDSLLITVIRGWFAKLGYRSEELDNTIRYVLSTDYSRCANLVNYRKIELEFAHSDLILPGRRFSNASLVEQLPEPWIQDEETAYNFTHEVFYITQMGREVGAISEDARAYLKRWLPLWISIYHSKSNPDIVGEYLLCQKLLGFRSDYEKQVDLFLQAQDAEGAFKGPSQKVETKSAKSPPDAKHYFRLNYHTTLVGLMALAGD